MCKHAEFGIPAVFKIVHCTDIVFKVFDRKTVPFCNLKRAGERLFRPLAEGGCLGCCGGDAVKGDKLCNICKHVLGMRLKILIELLFYLHFASSFLS